VFVSYLSSGRIGEPTCAWSQDETGEQDHIRCNEMKSTRQIDLKGFPLQSQVLSLELRFCQNYSFSFGRRGADNVWVPLGVSLGSARRHLHGSRRLYLAPIGHSVERPDKCNPNMSNWWPFEHFSFAQQQECCLDSNNVRVHLWENEPEYDAKEERRV